MDNQFKISIEQHITNMYNHTLAEFYKAVSDLNESPRSHSAKTEWRKCLAEKQTLESLLLHIEDGSYDSEEYYTKYLNPKTRFKV
jgi:cytochrome b involved in lipid metabolism